MASNILFEFNAKQESQAIINHGKNKYNTISNFNDTNPIYSNRIEISSNSSKRPNYNYKTIFEDLKYNVNYKSGKNSDNTNNNSAKSLQKKEENNTMKKVFSGKTRESINKK